MRLVKWAIIRGKNCPYFSNPRPKSTYSLCHCQGTTTNIKPCIWGKIAFIPLCRLKTSLRMRNITRPVHRGPKTTLDNFWPRISIHYNHLYGGMTTIMGILYFDSPMLKRFSAAKTVQSKLVPKMVVFRKFKGLNIKYCHGTTKRHSRTRIDVIWHIFRKNPFGV